MLCQETTVPEWQDAKLISEQTFVEVEAVLVDSRQTPRVFLH